QAGQIRLLPVVALEDANLATALAEALINGGLPCMEITLRTPTALDSIRAVRDREDLLLGAGTVHSAEQAAAAVEAGAQFIVTPGFNPRTVRWCIDHNIPVFPGTSSPTDLESALELGLKVVKFFPAETLGGVETLKAFSGPYGDLKFIPTGGISPSNLRSYLQLPGVVACGGSWMVRPSLLQSGDFATIQTL